ncbi:uncharacterized protein LOC126979974 [Leptidea sinapis]|uniref:uncharacterized protein LOC126979974 n=1 Tax=Leptidea sinapis TaxID=189913 RepID=UPI0021C2CE14|nr:uncharacterized protein LOC126979974 [Leptidea sinapis]
MATVNHNLPSEVSGGVEAGTSTRGHTNVCLLCGCSILQQQSDIVLRENPTEMQQSIYNIIESRVAPRQISSVDHICHACWMRTKREVIRMNRQDENRPLRDLTDVDVQQDESQPNEAAPAEPTQLEPSVRTHQIVLPHYRRAANSTHNCVFPNCSSTTFHNISDKLRATVLHNHHYYLPKLARICSEHLTNNSWDTLLTSDNSIETFNVEQIQHVFSFVNTFSPTLDFDDIQNMDNRVFQYWIGLTKEKFNMLIEEVPRISQLHRGVLGTAALLLKMRTGDSDERIATLLQVPRRTLEGLMDKVREILCQDFVTRHLGINHITHEELLEHNLTIPNGLFGGEIIAIVICDGTYIYIY